MEENQHIHKTRKQLRQLKDEELVKFYRDGSHQAVDILVQRYKNFVRSKVRTNFFVGADREDLIQEGMIGLFKAINDYDIRRKASFRSFASLCIKGQISTAFKTATRQKHMALNTSISLDKPLFVEDENKTTLMDILRFDCSQGPEEVLVHKEKMNDIEKQLNTNLSKLEASVLQLYLEGQSYYEISEKLGKPTKSVDNALQRIKRKLEGLYDQEIAT